MKHLILIIFFSTLTGLVYSQTINVDQKHRLILEIKKCNYIESYCLGYACNSHSVLYKKADSLLVLTTVADILDYFNDTSYSLKYYSFLYLLEIDDTIAFELIKRNISDTKTIDYTFADLSSNAKFINLIISEYLDFVKTKYRFGGQIIIRGHRSVSFPPANKSVYREKIKQLNQLLKTNNIAFK